MACAISLPGTTAATISGFLTMLKNNYNLDVPNNDRAIDALAEAGVYIIGDAAQVTRQLKDFYVASGGFGTLLMVCGKAWADAANDKPVHILDAGCGYGDSLRRVDREPTGKHSQAGKHRPRVAV